MKTTYIVRWVDNLGRLVIPREIRKSMNITTETLLEFFIDKENNMIGIKPVQPQKEKK